jgi:anaerobic magnesium-protoporphyrin IX monomethyl ester cyclase
MRVLFLNPPFLKNFIRSSRCTWLPISGSNWYPIFLAYAAGWLEKHNHVIKLVDAPVTDLSPKEVCQIAKEFIPEILVLYVSEQSLISDIKIGKLIKKLTKCKLALVGPWCATDPKGLINLDKEIDFVVKREFDGVILDLANKKSPKEIKGLVFKDGNKITVNTERDFLSSEQLNQLPYIAEIYKKHLSINKYYQASLLHPFVDLFTARGCAWNHCSFCLWPNTIHKGACYRPRDIENVVGEFKYIRKELPNIKEIFIQDDMLPALRARELSRALIKAKIKILWSCYVKGDIDYETLSLMKKSGCRYLHVGYESADNQILKNTRKGITAEIMKEFTENTKKVGLKVHGDFIIGLPGESELTIRKTIDWAKDLKIEGYQFFIPQPHESTPLYRWLKRRKYLSNKGEINYPFFSKEKLSYWRFKAMREIYINPQYVIRVLKNTNSIFELFRLSRTALYVIPNILFPKKHISS